MLPPLKRRLIHLALACAPLALLPVASAQPAAEPIVGETARLFRTTVAQDNLWDIAGKVARQAGVGRQQVMVAVLRRNPDAFVKGNIHRLRQGVPLVLPSLGELKAEDRAASVALVGAHLAALKSGAYSIQRPLHLGALAGGASPEQSGALERFGHHLGRAFAWRDDVLGVWGDSARTGKPVGDDLREGKATLIWVLGVERLTGRDAVAMRRVGTLMFADDDVHRLQRALEEAGVRDEMERLIDAEVEAAEAILDGSPLTPAGIAGLRGAAHDIAWRSA